MSTVLEPSLSSEQPEVDRFRYGWRYLRQAGPDGKEQYVQVPLTQEDVLHPQEDDFIVQNDEHRRDCRYLEVILDAHLANQPDLYVFHDHRIDWGAEGVRAHGPDFAVIAGVPADWDRLRGTFFLAEFGAKPVLVIEVTSPSTRETDLDDKVDEYFQAGVPFYAIVDRLSSTGQPRVLAYRASEQGYVRLRPDPESWLELEPIGLWLAFEEGRLVGRDGQGRRLRDYREVMREMQEADIRARQALAQVQVEARARQEAETRAQAEAQARQQAEERIRQLEAELNRLRGQS